MQTTQYATRYAEAQVMSVDPKRLLLLMFEGGTRFLGRCREALVAGQLERFSENLARAQAIISELMNTLDHRAGGQIATDLARLYEFMLFHLTEANVKRSLQHVDDVIRVFAIVSDGFRQILATEAPSAGQSVAAQ